MVCVIGVLQELLGHSGVTTTQVYIHGMSTDLAGIESPRSAFLWLADCQLSAQEFPWLSPTLKENHSRNVSAATFLE